MHGQRYLSCVNNNERTAQGCRIFKVYGVVTYSIYGTIHMKYASLDPHHVPLPFTYQLAHTIRAEECSKCRSENHKFSFSPFNTHTHTHTHTLGQITQRALSNRKPCEWLPTAQPVREVAKRAYKGLKKC